MRLATTAHTSIPRRIHELTRDFPVEDVRPFRTLGAGPGDFPAMLAATRMAAGPATLNAPARFPLALRRRLGALLGRAPGANGAHELRMAALVKPNGRLRRLHRAAIASFRHLAVCPALTRQRERAWRADLERTSR
ncbi:hypothetical protein [Nonomuraea sp. GTA35]|uniref:hypothetical protein n=1 Tax=Nonomuraea sp. GTA35 TaxID=1676746 RepID=UPI0035C26BB3